MRADESLSNWDSGSHYILRAEGTMEGSGGLREVQQRTRTLRAETEVWRATDPARDSVLHQGNNPGKYPDLWPILLSASLINNATPVQLFRDLRCVVVRDRLLGH